MNQQASNRDLRANGQASKPTSKPAFKPVALPAVAAVRAAKLQPSRPKASQPPAILRKEAVLG